jgi:hypothetical protein
MRPTLSTIAAVVIAAIAPTAAHAQQSAPYGGGTLPPLEVKGYHPTVGVTLQPTGDGMLARFDTTLICGGTVFFIDDTGKALGAGPHYDIHGTGHERLVRGSMRFHWYLSVDLDSHGAHGTLRVDGRDKLLGHTHRCRRAASRRTFQALVSNPPVGSPAAPRPGAAYLGLSDRRLSPGVPAPVLIRVGADGRRISARWSFSPHCSDHGNLGFNVNFSDIPSIAADGSFGHDERFKLRLHDAVVRAHASFGGHFTGDGATGTLRMRARVFDRHNRHLIARCDTGVGQWTTLVAP